MKSIRTKFFLVFLSVLICYALIGIMLNVFFLEHYYIQQNKTHFKEVAQSAKFFLNTENAADKIESLAHDEGVFIAVTDKNFRVVMSSNNLQSQTLPPEVISCIRGNKEKEIYVTTEHTENIPKLVYMISIESGRRIVLTSSIRIIKDSIKIANQFYIFTGFLILMIGGVMVYIFSKKLTAPIIQMSLISKKMSTLIFDEKIDIKSKDELGELSENINQLSDSLKTAMDKLKKDNAFQKTLSRNLSHELKTPIAVMKGYAEGLLYSVPESEEEKEHYLKIIVSECDRMDHMVKEILTLSKLSVYNNNTYEFPEFSAKSVCKNIEERFEREFINHKIKFEYSYQDINLKGDFSLIIHAVSNYILNAINHSTGEVKLNIKICVNTFIISVFNTGSNIPDNELSHIFEPFYKIDFSRNRSHEGHGLGLAIVRSIAEIHKGTVYAENVENGVCFYFELPL